MKKVIIISILSLLIQSCANFNFGNFNKQKFTHLKTKSVKFEDTKIVDQPNVIDKLKVAKIKEVKQQQPNQAIIDKSHSYNETIAQQKIITKKIKQKESTHKLESNKKRFNKVKSINISKTFSRVTKDKTNGLFFFLILLGLPVMFIKKSGYKIATWGKNNIKKAQVLIGVFTVTGLFSSYMLGNIFDFNISKPMLLAPLVLGGSSLLINKVKTKKHFFKDKLSISMFSTSGLFMSFGAGSNANFLLLQSSYETAVHPVLGVFLTILIIGLLALSIYGLAALACQIACSGYTVLAGIVFFGGSGGFIYLASFAIYKLFRNKNKPKKKKVETKPKKDINTILLIIAVSLLILLLIL